MKKSLYTILTFARISTRRYFRDKTAIFFTVLFPLIFLFVFGSFSKGAIMSHFHIGLLLIKAAVTFLKNMRSNLITAKLLK
jgi:hypothetical protein